SPSPAVRSAGISHGTLVSTTTAHRSASMTRAKYPIHSGRRSYPPEGLPPLEVNRRHRLDLDAARLGEPARPSVDVVGAVRHSEPFAGHSSVVDEPVRQLGAGCRHPLERLVGGWCHVTRSILLLPQPRTRCRHRLPRRCPNPTSTKRQQLLTTSPS